MIANLLIAGIMGTMTKESKLKKVETVIRR